MQQAIKQGQVLCKRAGIYGGRLNRRRRGKTHQVEEWIKYYQNKLAKGEYCPKRVAKILAHFEKALEHGQAHHPD